MSKGKRPSAIELGEETVARIRADVASMKAGTYDPNYGPASGPTCTCGLRTKWIPEGLNDYEGEIDRRCQRHEVG